MIHLKSWQAWRSKSRQCAVTYEISSCCRLISSFSQHGKNEGWPKKKVELGANEYKHIASPLPLVQLCMEEPHQNVTMVVMAWLGNQTANCFSMVSLFHPPYCANPADEAERNSVGVFGDDVVVRYNDAGKLCTNPTSAFHSKPVR